MRRDRPFVALLAAVALSGCKADPFAGAGCTIASAGEMQVLTTHFSPVIPVTLDGHRAAMTVDTGGVESLLSSSVVDQFRLSQHPTQTVLAGVDGTSFVNAATINSLQVGSGTIHGISLFIMPAQTRPEVAGLPLAGLFGGNFLYNYDVYFDLPDRQFALYEEFHCPDKADASAGLGWRRPAYVLSFRDSDDSVRDITKIHVTVSLNGTPIDAELDSGAAVTMIAARDAARAGVSEAMLARDDTRDFSGIVGASRQARVHRFTSLDVGPEHFTDLPLYVADTGTATLLGADFLRTHRVVVSYQHRQVIVEPSDRVVAAPVAATAGPAAAL